MVGITIKSNLTATEIYYIFSNRANSRSSSYFTSVMHFYVQFVTDMFSVIRCNL